jgi:hypothetical protein
MFNIKNQYHAMGELPRLYIAIILSVVALSSTIGVVMATNALIGTALVCITIFPAVYKFRRIFLMSYAVYLPFEELFLKIVPEQTDLLFRYGGEVIIFFLFMTILTINILKGKGWKKTVLDIPILLLAFATIVSTSVNSVSPVTAAVSVESLFRYIFLFFIFTQSDFSKEDIRIFLNIFIISGALQIIAGFVQIIGAEAVYDFFRPKDIIVGGQILRSQEITLDDSGLRICGTLVRYGIFGNFIAMVLCALLAKMYVSKEKNPFIFILIILGAAVLVASFSRKGWVAVFAAYIFMNMALGKKTKASLILGVSIIMLVFLIAGYGFVGSLAGTATNNPMIRLVEMFSPDYLSHSLERTRLYILFYVSYKIAANYFWFGLGPGVLNSILSGAPGGKSALFGATNISGVDFADERLRLLTDVGFVNIFAQIGFFGILALLLILFQFYRHVRNLLKNEKIPEIKALALMTLGFTVIMVIEQLFGSALNYRAVSFYFWLFAGLVFSALRTDPTDPTNRQEPSYPADGRLTVSEGQV